MAIETWRNVLYSISIALPGFILGIALWGVVDKKGTLFSRNFKRVGYRTLTVARILTIFYAMAAEIFLMRVPYTDVFRLHPGEATGLLGIGLLLPLMLAVVIFPVTATKQPDEPHPAN